MPSLKKMQPRMKSRKIATLKSKVATLRKDRALKVMTAADPTPRDECLKWDSYIADRENCDKEWDEWWKQCFDTAETDICQNAVTKWDNQDIEFLKVDAPNCEFHWDNFYPVNDCGLQWWKAWDQCGDDVEGQTAPYKWDETCDTILEH